MEHPESRAQLTSHQYRNLERIVERFEEAWFAGERPSIEAHLPTDPLLRRAVVIELAHIDLEFRRKAGLAPVPAEYVSRFPDLKSDKAFAPDLLKSSNRGPEAAALSETASTEAGTKTATWSSFLPGKELGNYTVLEMIGIGGMGIVFKAQHRRMKRIVAIKMLRPSALEFPGAVKRFHREVETVAKLAHPNIVVAHDADEFDGNHFLVMEFVEGVDLHRHVRQHGPLPVGEAVNAVLQTATGLDYAHRHGIIHRDVKPANLLLDQKGIIKILDLGLARLQSRLNALSPGEEPSALTDLGMTVGTMEFMAPEQAVDSSQADVTSDVYSLGATLYYLLIGKPPFGGATGMMQMFAHRESPIPSLRAGRTDVPPGIDLIFQRMLAKRKADRYPSMAELIGDLNRGHPAGA